MFGCVYLPNFICQAALRLQPDLRNKAVAIFEGAAPLTRIVAVNAKARKAGIFVGMTKTEAEGHHEVILRQRGPDLEVSAHAALLDCGQKFSPRIEDVRMDTAILDLSGLHKLMGTSMEVAHSIRDQARALSLYTRVGIASSIDVALFAARGTRGILIVPEGEESRMMQDFTIGLLELERTTAEVFRSWGIHRFGELAALPTPALIERLGQRGLQLQRLVRGEFVRVLSPTISPRHFVEAMDLDHAVSDTESLAFVFRIMLDQLCGRLASHALATAELEIALTLDLSQEDAIATHEIFRRSIKLPLPTIDGKLLLKLVQLDLAAHPPGAAVQKLKLEAYPVQPQHVQEGMFVPQGPEPQHLQITLARLYRIVGEERAGSPEIIEQHTTNTFQMTRFIPDASAGV